MHRPIAILLGMLVSSALAGGQQSSSDLDTLRKAFLNPAEDARVMMRWWWFGPAITTAQIVRDLDAMRDGGIGGVEIQPVYPFALDDESRGRRNLQFLSDAFLEALGTANREARARGLRVDLTLGSGWPYGGPTVQPDEAASRLRWERIAVPAGSRRVAIPSISAGEAYLTGFIVRDGDPASAAPLPTPTTDGTIWLTSSMAEGREAWFFLASRTGMMVKRPAYGAEGFVVDHYHRPALDAYLSRVGERLLQPFAGAPPYAIFCDSLEVYNSDWAPDFPAEFARRRGYDVLPHLPQLAAGTGTAAAQVREDWGRTLTELVDERFLGPLAEWARGRGTRLRVQGYGIPPATISSNAVADLPEGEGAQWRQLTPSRWAASAAHLQQRPVVSSETWTWLHSPAFRATPLDLKAEADRHFLQGITQLIGHGWPSTPAGEPYPGWRFYAAGAYTDANPWWIVMPDVTRYLQRVSHMMRQGTPAADVAIYLPAADAFAGTKLGHLHLLELLREHLGDQLVGPVLDAGYAFDFIDDAAMRHATVESGSENTSDRTAATLVAGGGRYRLVLLPGVEAMPVDVLQRVDAFTRAGGRVVATRRLPSRVPGRHQEPASAEVERLAMQMFTDPSRAALVRNDEELEAVMHGLLSPQLHVVPRTRDIGFAARRVGRHDLFFVANTGNIARRVSVTARTRETAAEWWDPLTARMTPVPATAAADALTVSLELPAYGSGILVTHSLPPAARQRRAGVANELAVAGPWTITFQKTGDRTEAATLESWTMREETRYYSGTVSYETTLTIAERAGARGSRVVLRFGDGKPVPETPRRLGSRAWLDAPVRDAAVVYLDERRAGSVWSPPFTLDITEHVRPGRQRLRIVVGNTAMNHMAGHPQPDFRLLHLRYGERFQPQDMDAVAPLPSGLLSPITVVVEP